MFSYFWLLHAHSKHTVMFCLYESPLNRLRAIYKSGHFRFCSFIYSHFRFRDFIVNMHAVYTRCLWYWSYVFCFYTCTLHSVHGISVWLVTFGFVGLHWLWAPFFCWVYSNLATHFVKLALSCPWRRRFFFLLLKRQKLFSLFIHVATKVKFHLMLCESLLQNT